jgi:DGQHR domain-containing protein
MNQSINVAQPRIPVSLGQLPRTKVKIAVGVIRVGDLIPRYEIVRREHYSRSGYQREPSRVRVNKLMTALKDGMVDLPTAILLNMRSFEIDEHMVAEASRWVFLPGPQLFVVDGQHRVEALKELFESLPDGRERWADFEIPFVCMLGADEKQEMEQFYVVNSNAKSVPTALAYDLLKQMAEASPDLMESLQETGRDWQVRAQGISERLGESPIWQGRIHFPREPRDGTTISNSGMANSLKPLFSHSYLSQITTDNQLKILQAYWEGIRRVIPDAFGEPEVFSIQKAVGVNALHSLLPTVMELVRAKNGSVLDPEEYREVLDVALTELEETTPSGDKVTGADFWRAAPDGAAGLFSSNAGRRVLIARIKQRLPRINVV